MDTEIARATEIAKKNDEFRRGMSGCTVTRGVAALATFMNEIFVAVRDFSEFSEDNDPYGEHDFGSFEMFAHKFFWKIDYYDHTLTFGSENPADTSITTRVLTIMQASEY